MFRSRNRNIVAKLLQLIKNPCVMFESSHHVLYWNIQIGFLYWNVLNRCWVGDFGEQSCCSRIVSCSSSRVRCGSCRRCWNLCISAIMLTNDISSRIGTPVIPFSIDVPWLYSWHCYIILITVIVRFLTELEKALPEFPRLAKNANKFCAIHWTAQFYSTICKELRNSANCARFVCATLSTSIFRNNWGTWGVSFLAQASLLSQFV